MELKFFTGAAARCPVGELSPLFSLGDCTHYKSESRTYCIQPALIYRKFPLMVQGEGSREIVSH